jgi:hypothetical protein
MCTAVPCTDLRRYRFKVGKKPARSAAPSSRTTGSNSKGPTRSGSDRVESSLMRVKMKVTDSLFWNHVVKVVKHLAGSFIDHIAKVRNEDIVFATEPTSLLDCLDTVTKLTTREAEFASDR